MSNYINVDTNEKVIIIDDEDKFYTLSNGLKISKVLFPKKFKLENNQPQINLANETSVNPEDFLNTKTPITIKNNNEQKQNVNENFNNQKNVIKTDDDVVSNDFLNNGLNYNNIVNKLSNIDTSKIVDDNSKSVVTIKEYDEHGNLKNKFQNVNENNTNNINDKILSNSKNDDNIVVVQEEKSLEERKQELLKKYKNSSENVVINNQEDEDKRFLGENTNPIKQTMQNDLKINQNETNMVVNNSLNLFKNFRRNYDIVINLEIKNKISTPDFIKIMSEGIEGDIIKFYTDEILKDMFDNIKELEEKIYNKIYKEVYGEYKFEEEVIYDKDKMIKGKKTKAGKQTYKFLNKKNDVIELLFETGKNKKYKPLKNE